MGIKRIKQSKQFRNTVKYIKSVDFILNKSTKIRQLRETLVFSTDDTRTIEYFMSKIIENKSQLLPHIIKNNNEINYIFTYKTEKIF